MSVWLCNVYTCVYMCKWMWAYACLLWFYGCIWRNNGGEYLWVLSSLFGWICCSSIDLFAEVRYSQWFGQPSSSHHLICEDFVRPKCPCTEWPHTLERISHMVFSRHPPSYTHPYTPTSRRYTPARCTYINTGTHLCVGSTPRVNKMFRCMRSVWAIAVIKCYVEVLVGVVKEIKDGEGSAPSRRVCASLYWAKQQDYLNGGGGGGGITKHRWQTEKKSHRGSRT